MIFNKGLKKRHQFIRLVQVVIAIALSFWLYHLWQTSLNNGQKLIASQTEYLARTLAQQAANGAAPAMSLNNDEQVQWIADTLADNPRVKSVNIYNSQGVRLAFAQTVTTDDLGPDSEALRQLLQVYPPLIENVEQNGNNLGYVEVRLEASEFFNELKYLHAKNMELTRWMLVVAAFIGFSLSRALSFKRAEFVRRKARMKKGKNYLKKIDKKNKKAEKTEQ